MNKSLCIASPIVGAFILGFIISWPYPIDAATKVSVAIVISVALAPLLVAINFMVLCNVLRFNGRIAVARFITIFAIVGGFMLLSTGIEAQNIYNNSADYNLLAYDMTNNG